MIKINTDLESFLFQDICGEPQRVYVDISESGKKFLGWERTGKMTIERRKACFLSGNAVGYTGKTFILGEPKFFLTFLGMDIDDVEGIEETAQNIREFLPWASVRLSSSGKGLHVISRITPVEFDKGFRVNKIVEEVQRDWKVKLEKAGIKVCKADFRCFILSGKACSFLYRSEEVLDLSQKIEEIREKKAEQKPAVSAPPSASFSLSSEQKELLEILAEKGIEVKLFSGEEEKIFTNIYVKEVYEALKGTKFEFQTASKMRSGVAKHNNGFFLSTPKCLLLKAFADEKACIFLRSVEEGKEEVEEGKTKKKKGESLLHFLLKKMEEKEMRMNILTNQIEMKTGEGRWEILHSRHPYLLSTSAQCLVKTNSEVKPRQVENVARLKAEKTPYNPDEYIPDWNGTDYLEKACNLVELEDEEDREFFLEMMKKWWVGCYASFFQNRPNEICPILSAPQGLGKKTWVFSLVHSEFRKYVYQNADIEKKKGLDVLESTFIAMLYDFTISRKSQLKAVISQREIRDIDGIGKKRASFIGFTEKEHFLVEKENRRFPVIRMKNIKLGDVDTVQLLAQAKHLFNSGFRYWLDQGEIKNVNEKAKNHIYRTRFVDYLENNVSEKEEENGIFYFQNLLEISSFLRIPSLNRDEYAEFGEAIRTFGGEQIFLYLSGKRKRCWKLALKKNLDIERELYEELQKIEHIEGKYTIIELAEKFNLKLTFLPEIEKILSEKYESEKYKNSIRYILN